MFGLGMSEMVVIGVVALIVIGPKDLPGVFRTMGQFTGKARMMAREFSRAMDQAASETGMNEVSQTLKAAANPQKFGTDKLKEATGMGSNPTRQPLSPERQEAKEKMSDAMAKAATERQAREAAQEAEAQATAAADASASNSASDPAPDPAPEAKT